jgi:hypothetical protein
MTVNTTIKAYSQGPFSPDFYRTYSTTTIRPGEPEGGKQFELGSLVDGENATQWMFVKCAAAVKQFDCVVIDELFNATSVTNANSRYGYTTGYAQVAFAAGDVGWVALQGSGVQCRTKGVLRNSVFVCAPATASGSAGVLRGSAAGRLRLAGLRVVSTATGSGTGVRSPEIQARWPLFTLIA